MSCSPVRRYSCSSSGGGDVPGLMDLGSLSGEGDRSRNASGSASYYQVCSMTIDCDDAISH